MVLYEEYHLPNEVFSYYLSCSTTLGHKPQSEQSSGLQK